MKTRDLVQTVIFICCLTVIPMFGLSYYIYAQTNLDFSMIIDKSFGVVIGVFGGIATLVAAYIASLLYVNWKDQAKHNKSLDLLSDILGQVNIIHRNIIYIQINNYPKKMKQEFSKLNLNEFLEYSDNIYKQCQKLHNDIIFNYNNLNSMISKFSLVHENYDENFEYILNNYFKVMWCFPSVIEEYMGLLIKAKRDGKSLQDLDETELFRVRELQLSFNIDPYIQKDTDGSYFFITTLFLSELREKSFSLLREIRKFI